MRSFGTFASAARFCCAFDKRRNSFRFRRSRGEMVSLAKQRQLLCQRLTALQALMEAVSSPAHPL
jgi:putative transposase